MHPQRHIGFFGFSAFSVVLVFVVLSIIGVSLLHRVSVNLNPHKQNRTLFIRFSCPKSAPKVVEHEATAKLEASLATLEGIENLRSESGEDYGYITVEAKKEVDLSLLRFKIVYLVKDLWQHLPGKYNYPIISEVSDEQQKASMLLSYSIFGTVPKEQLTSYVKNILIPQISRIEGVQKIEVTGEDTYEWVFEYNPYQLQLIGISPNDIHQSLQNCFQIKGLGEVDVGYGSKHKHQLIWRSSFDTTFRWSMIPVKKCNNRLYRLGDLVKARFQPQEKQSYYRINGEETLGINIFTTSDANQITVANLVFKQLESANKRLPNGVSIHKAWDASSFLRLELYKTIQRSSLSLFVLLIVLFAIYRKLKNVLVVLIALAANLAISFVFFYLLNVEIHIITMAGIAISLGIIVDSSIMMVDQLVRKKNLQIFMPILASTLTMASTLILVYFLNDAQVTVLADFSMAVLLNIGISLFISLFLVPALVNQLGITRSNTALLTSRTSYRYRLYVHYAFYLNWVARHKVLIIVFMVLSFGIPLNQLPKSVNNNNWYSGVYNGISENEYYCENVKPWVNRIFGGSLYLFSKNLSNVSHKSQRERENVLVFLKLPQGCSIHQLNQLSLQFEEFLKKQEGIEHFQAQILGPQNGQISIYFKKQFEGTSYPLQIRNLLERKANEYNGADFMIYGIIDKGFSNELGERPRSTRILLKGYNHHELIDLAHKVVDTLHQNRRIENLAIFSGEYAYGGITNEEPTMQLNRQQLILRGVPYFAFAGALQSVSANHQQQGYVVAGSYFTQYKLVSSTNASIDYWRLQHMPIGTHGSWNKLDKVATISNARVDNSIVKINQEYVVTIAYDFIGPEELNKMVADIECARIKSFLPTGYTVATPQWEYMYFAKGFPFRLIILVVFAIFVITAALFNSLKQAFIVISLIPISFIGIFLTFSIFEIPFDDGGYASFVFLAGLSANATIYILNEMNAMRHKKHLDHNQAYLKAFNAKLFPLVVASLTSMAGLLPFVFFDKDGVFWYSLATGTIGGILFNSLVILFILPAFILPRTPKNLKA